MIQLPFPANVDDNDASEEAHGHEHAKHRPGYRSWMVNAGVLMPLKHLFSDFHS